MNNFKKHLADILPPHLMPGNVGNIDEVVWPFWYPVLFDLGIDPTFSINMRQTAFFQNTQEAGFLLLGVARKAWDSTNAGDLAPLEITIRDRQSSRQFNDAPIPIQNIGKKHQMTILTTPMLIAPSAYIDVELTSWLTATLVPNTTGTMATTGNGKHEFLFFGYRIRSKNMEKMLSTIFA